MTETLPISQLPHGQAINAVSAAAVITLDRCIVGSSVPLAGTFTTVSAATPLTPSSGGTGNAYIRFTGPTTERTFTVPNASTTLLTTNALVTVSQGGTGLGTLTANNVILGAGTSTPTFVAPSTSGNVLTSNGTTWTSSTPAGSSGVIKISTQTASNSASLNFTSGIDSTYRAYVFIYKAIIPATDATDLYMSSSTDGGVSYAVTKQQAQARRASSTASWTYNGAAAVVLGYSLSNSLARYTANGTVTLYNPSDTTAYKLIGWESSMYNNGAEPILVVGAGSFETASAINAVQFIMSAGNITSGDITMYGIL